jgi:hypothetical protein
MNTLDEKHIEANQERLQAKANHQLVMLALAALMKHTGASEQSERNMALTKELQERATR